MTTGTPSFFNTHPRVCALVLAASNGSRLFPMTSSEMPKHLLPVAGIPCILRLLEHLSHVPQIVVALSSEDTVTVPLLQSALSCDVTSEQRDDKATIILLKSPSKIITVVKLSADCFGPVDALREIEESKIIHPSTRLVVFPGDLVFLDKDVNLDALLRPPQECDCTVLLVDVGEVDENGVPLKESAKAKKGSLSRDEEEIEYIGLSYALPSGTFNDSAATSLPRIVLKQSKIDVERDEEMTGSTSKLEVPKARLRHGKLVVKTSWTDVHVYSFAPWIRQIILTRQGLSSIQEDVLPLLISRQFRGKKATLGKSTQQQTANDSEKENTNNSTQLDDLPYAVTALVLPSTTVMRAITISSFHYACRETIANGERLTMPPESKWNGKFQTVILANSILGAKINMKSSVVGKGCSLGAKCRLNNVIIMDNVMIGENCSLQNTVIGPGAKVGNNCSLNDCQVGPGKELPPGTKEKGESFMVGDAIVEDLL